MLQNWRTNTSTNGSSRRVRKGINTDREGTPLEYLLLLCCCSLKLALPSSILLAICSSSHDHLIQELYYKTYCLKSFIINHHQLMLSPSAEQIGWIDQLIHRTQKIKKKEIKKRKNLKQTRRNPCCTKLCLGSNILITYWSKYHHDQNQTIQGTMRKMLRTSFGIICTSICFYISQLQWL